MHFAEKRELRTTGRRQLACMLHARHSVVTTLRLVLLTVEAEGWEASGGAGFARKLLGFVGAFRSLCEAQKYAEAVDRAAAFFRTNAAQAYYARERGADGGDTPRRDEP
jgi:hypothetical protein